MFSEEDLKCMDKEDREAAIDYMNEFIEFIAIGNGDYLEEDGRIIIED